jgi:hypothetical protein
MTACLRVQHVIADLIHSVSYLLCIYDDWKTLRAQGTKNQNLQLSTHSDKESKHWGGNKTFKTVFIYFAEICGKYITVRPARLIC